MSSALHRVAWYTETTCYSLGGLVAPRPIPGRANAGVTVAAWNVGVGLVPDAVVHGLLEFTDVNVDPTVDEPPIVRTLPRSVGQS